MSKKSKSLEVSFKPLWQSPLIVGIVVGFLGIASSVATWYFAKPPTFDQNVIGFSQMSYLDFQIAKVRFNSENQNLVDVLLPIHVNGGANAAVYFNRGLGDELISFSHDKMDFNIMISHLKCGVKYSFRVQPILNGKRLSGANSNFDIPPCESQNERELFVQDPHYVRSFYLPTSGIVN